MAYDVDFLRKYIPAMELAVLIDNTKGEEGGYFQELLSEIERKIKAMPPLYAQESKGEEAVIGMHYFGGAVDFWLTELDPETREAFGLTCLGDMAEAELGYQSIEEIVATGRIELDLYWQPATIRETRQGGS